MFFLLKSCILWKYQLKIVKNCSILENQKLGLARFCQKKAWLGSACLFWKKLSSACLIKKLGLARQNVGSDPTLVMNPLTTASSLFPKSVIRCLQWNTELESWNTLQLHHIVFYQISMSLEIDVSEKNNDICKRG